MQFFDLSSILMANLVTQISLLPSLLRLVFYNHAVLVNKRFASEPFLFFCHEEQKNLFISSLYSFLLREEPPRLNTSLTEFVIFFSKLARIAF